MKAISIHQPWADLIVLGDKDIENRSWTTRHRGRVLIHAGLTVERDAVADLQAWARENDWEYPDQPDTGCLLGFVTLADVVTESDSGWFNGPFGWVLTEPHYFQEPVPYRGRLGLFEVPDELVAAAIAAASPAPPLDD
ncbi:MAG: ASCH domain-containing protein [Anaerolineae bacterium]|jgi:hypothetical protein